MSFSVTDNLANIEDSEKSVPKKTLRVLGKPRVSPHREKRRGHIETPRLPTVRQPHFREKVTFGTELSLPQAM